jgi:hypothetical protein
VKRGSKNSSAEEYRKVIESVKDYIFQTHRFPQVTDIVKLTGIPRSKCRDICGQLIGQKQLYEVFGGPSLPTVVLPYEMLQSVLRTQSKPKWMTEHSFKEKTELDDQINKLTSKVTEYEIFERLLYTTDIPLEEAVAFVLEWLGFEDVVHHKEDKDNPDITFIYEGVKALVEIEGTTKAGDKIKAQQLDGWMKREIINFNRKASELKGFFIVNHFRETKPEKRGEPLTTHAKEFLKLNQSRFFTTYFLLNIVKDVMASLSKKEARKKVWEGEKID